MLNLAIKVKFAYKNEIWQLPRQSVIAISQNEQGIYDEIEVLIYNGGDRSASCCWVDVF